MTNQHRDKDQQNYLLDQARAIHNELETSVFGPSGADTPSCAEAWPTAKLIAALIHRIEALEAAQSAILARWGRNTTKESALNALEHILRHSQTDHGANTIRRALEALPDD